MLKELVKVNQELAIELWKAKFKLNKNVIKSAKEVQKINLKNSKWIVKDAIML